MITRREAINGALRALGGAAIALLVPFTVRARPTIAIARIYKGTVVLFERYPDGWLSSFELPKPWPSGHLQEYALRTLDSAKCSDPVESLWRTAKNTINMYMKVPGYTL